MTKLQGKYKIVLVMLNAGFFKASGTDAWPLEKPDKATVWLTDLTIATHNVGGVLGYWYERQTTIE